MMNSSTSHSFIAVCQSLCLAKLNFFLKQIAQENISRKPEALEQWGRKKLAAQTK
jgi:hypothetical protein